MRKNISAKKRRQLRTRAKIKGTKEVPRLSVFRSHNHIYAQLINDEENKTIGRATDFELKSKKSKKTEKAKKVGEALAKKARDLGVEKIVFDRGGYKYHGRVKALAEGARQRGLKF